MPDADHLTNISEYTIDGPAGRISKSGLTNHDVQATAWAALGAVTAARWDRLELRQRRAGVFELEGHNGPDDHSGVYLLTLGETPPLPTEGHQDSTTPASKHLIGEERDERPIAARRSPDSRPSWTDRMPGAQATLTRAEVVARVNMDLDRPISAVAIEEWEREGVLPIPSGDLTTPSYPEAASHVILTLISLQQSSRAHLDILERLRSTVEDLNTHADIAIER